MGSSFPLCSSPGDVPEDTLPSISEDPLLCAVVTGPIGVVKWGFCVSIIAVWLLGDSGSRIGLFFNSEGTIIASEDPVLSPGPSSVSEAAVGEASVFLVEAPCWGSAVGFSVADGMSRKDCDVINRGGSYSASRPRRLCDVSIDVRLRVTLHERPTSFPTGDQEPSFEVEQPAMA